MNIGQILVGAGAAALPTASAGAAAGRSAAAAVAHAAAPNVPRSIATAALRGLLRGGSPPSAQRQAEQLGDLLSRFARGAAAATTTAATAKASSTTAKTSSTTTSGSASSSLAYLKDARLSVEERLARLMVQLSDKYEKQLELKLQQYADLEGGKGTTSSTKSLGSSAAKKSSSSSASSSSPLSALGDGLSKLVSKAGLGKEILSGSFLPKLASQVAGPVLAGAATALGLPALAPLILKAGPLLGSIASEAVAGLTGSAAGTTPGKSAASTTSAGSPSAKSASSSSSGSSGSSSTSAPSEKQLMTEIQILQDKQKEMFSLVSNILRSMHDTKMAVIGNVR